MDTILDMLIVEDSPTQAEQLREVLERHGNRVRVAHNGREALDAIRQHRPTIVITGVIMPEMDGYELCRQIKADPQLNRIAVMLLTCLSDPADVILGLECGADSFTVKPWEEHQILSRIGGLWANHELRETSSTQLGVEITFADKRFLINSDRLQILNLLIASYETATHKSAALARAQDDLLALNEQLEEKVCQRTAALKAEVAERGRAEGEIHILNVELERRVLERTRQLEDVNRELESFSYSVSHDLRAPLRHIQGYVELLDRASNGELPEKARHYLKEILDVSGEMGQLIDAILAFSHTGRTEMGATSVDLDSLLQETIRGLKMETQGRAIVWKIAPLPQAVGDRAMLKQVMINLVGNAVKYSAMRDPAEIEIGCAGEEEGRSILFVRDNGAGFDMQYVDKLFGVFQRLHRAEEFEGTGIGLAIVRRIIARHGGRAWAEGAVDHGATFYFTLPRSDSEQADSRRAGQ